MSISGKLVRFDGQEQVDMLVTSKRYREDHPGAPEFAVAPAKPSRRRGFQPVVPANPPAP